MVSIRNERFMEFKNGSTVVIAEIQVDSADELPASYYLGRYLYQGSIAWDISTGDFYALSGSGEWVKQNGGGDNNA
ncbi:MAG: hypothetical protein IJ666_05450 [Ruminococcus sp.]|nr:hypothetical protein [Ruminococcus sp.]